MQERAAQDNQGQPAGASTSITVAAGVHDVAARQGSFEQSQHVVARGGEVVEVHFQRLPDAAEPHSTTSVGWLGAQSGPETREGVSTAPSRAKWITVIALGSGAVIAAGLGLGFRIAAQDKANDAAGVHAERGWTNAECHGAAGGTPLCMQLKSDVDANRLYWGIATAATIGAGVLAAASAATWVLWRPKSAVVVARPSVGARSAGLLLDGQW